MVSILFLVMNSCASLSKWIKIVMGQIFNCSYDCKHDLHMGNGFQLDIIRQIFRSWYFASLHF